ncbi:transcriptional regulator NrdR [Okeania sp.]|uniref:transcriptional regulator NrdR n=1 Tax=Okeania sp. TaxID=3100323 RepID=UPI002B4AF975|nr:transcriptional regulator NrdR [Okeania sp.]MEB3343788.1 transcriptional regulator NrdR [Okeania sp.]
MLCPICQHTNSRVLESRSAESGKSIRRRRECMNCQHRFTTYERIEFVTVTVIKRDNQKESFDKSKLLRGIIRSCEKTGIEVSQLEAIVNEIEIELQGRSQREITSAEIGEIVLSKLSGISEVAYIRFASVYRKFQGIRDFVDTLNDLQNQKDNLEFPKTWPESSDISLQEDTPDCETPVSCTT